MDTLRVKIKSKDAFLNGVFGAEDILRYFPELEIDGVDVMKQNDFYYIVKNGRMAGDCLFFSVKEMKEHLYVVHTE